MYLKSLLFIGVYIMNKYYGISEAEPTVRIKRRKHQLSLVNTFSSSQKVSLYISGSKAGASKDKSGNRKKRPR